RRPDAAPDDPARITVRFERGRPVAIDEKPVNLLEAFTLANRIGGEHGVGIGTHLVENRFVGIKSRGVYEAPGMEVLGTAYGFLLQLILDRRAREFFDGLSSLMAKQIYQGYGYDLATRMVREALRPVTELVTGNVTLSLYKGQASFHSAEHAPHSLYSEANSSMEAIGEFDHADSEGFLRVLSVSARALAAAGQVVGLNRPVG
ncbi:MAG: argininosuccinate synthase, partial [Isosphaeraceae bacterium]